ncbi:MAG: hypothetical protein PPFGHCPK_00831 [Spiroplasma endosymbiont of Drosophila atripex]|nr:MAG: hypothetical protein PPFGHCPK_00831 [Spiroplasma endosymbiont of Drosophila atripex]
MNKEEKEKVEKELNKSAKRRVANMEKRLTREDIEKANKEKEEEKEKSEKQNKTSKSRSWFSK